MLIYLIPFVSFLFGIGSGCIAQALLDSRRSRERFTDELAQWSAAYARHSKPHDPLERPPPRLHKSPREIQIRMQRSIWSRYEARSHGLDAQDTFPPTTIEL